MNKDMKTKPKIIRDETGITILFKNHWFRVNSDGTCSADLTLTKEINDYLESNYQSLNKKEVRK